MITEALEKWCYCLDVPMFFLRHGRAFKKYMPRPDWVERGIPKQCYSNCFQAALKNWDRLIYCEGMALPEGTEVPKEHAWVITHDEIVIDPTWHDLWPERKVEYWGIPLQWRFVVDTINRTHKHGIVDNWAEDHPLLKGKVPVEEYLWTPKAAVVRES